MPVTINGVELTDVDMEQELPLHADAPNPMRAATTALVLRRVLLDEAARQGLDLASEDDAIGVLLHIGHLALIFGQILVTHQAGVPRGRGWTSPRKTTPSASCWNATRRRPRPTRRPAGAITRPIRSASSWAS